jgi:2-polyprenyl-3-methyl-5-hydroxy-6-metoxy-1,4-benzoquinol methylase
MDKDLLLRIFGPSALLFHYDTLVYDRWNWLISRLPAGKDLRALDIGCGNGAFTMGLALRGYDCLGLSWDAESQKRSGERAAICGADKAKFEICDVRFLDKRKNLYDTADVIICLECIEHIFDDAKLMRDISACLKPGGKLLLTAPNYDYKPITGGYAGKAVVSKTEDGGHVRVGYTESGLRDLCKNAGLEVDEISYCSGFLSQKITGLFRLLERIHPVAGWLFILPLRIAVPLLDTCITKASKWEPYSICLAAHRAYIK